MDHLRYVQPPLFPRSCTSQSGPDGFKTRSLKDIPNWGELNNVVEPFGDTHRAFRLSGP